MIRRGPRERNFTVLPNDAINDERLSFKARGLLTYILSKPDHWKTNSAHLSSAGPDGITAVRTGLRELQQLGYATIVKERNADGTFVSEWVIGDSTSTKPDAGSSDAGRANAGKPVPLVSTEGVKTEVVKTEKNSQGESDFLDGPFSLRDDGDAA